MKTLLYIAMVLMIIVGCTTSKNISNSKDSRTIDQNKDYAQTDTVRIANDSIGYEVIVIDPGFTGWLAGRSYPRNFYSQTYLESKNRIWVFEWNIRANNPQSYEDLYPMGIDYSSGINYGYEVNYMLYNYLVYFQNKYKQNLGGNVPDR